MDVHFLHHVGLKRQMDHAKHECIATAESGVFTLASSVKLSVACIQIGSRPVKIDPCKYYATVPIVNRNNDLKTPTSE